VIGLSWARQFTDRVLFGGTANVVTERIASVSANGVAFDFGVQYLTGWNGPALRHGDQEHRSEHAVRRAGFDSAVQPPGAEPGASSRTLTCRLGGVRAAVLLHPRRQH
jgi:hypothetical protein